MRARSREALRRPKGRHVALTLAATGVVTVGVVVPAGIGRAESFETPPYDASAQANVVNIATTNATFPLGLLIEGGGPESHVRMTSLQQSDASASFPYLGTSIPTAPGLAASIVGLPLPNFPTTLTSSYGDSPRTRNFPGVALRAESGQATTLAAATAGSEGLAGGTSTSRVDVTPDGGVVSRAATSISALDFGGLVSVAGFRSDAQVSSDSGTGKLTKTSTLSIARLSAPGLALTIPAGGNIPPPFAGQSIVAPDLGFQDGRFTVTLPYLGEPQQFEVPAQSVLDAFKALGVTLEYQPATSGTTSIQGAQFVIKMTLPAPPANQAYNGETPVTYTLGQTLAAVTVSPLGGADDAVNGTDGAGTAPASGIDQASAPDTSAGAGPALSDVDAAGLLPTTTDALTPQVTDLPVAGQSLTAARFEPLAADFGATRFYLALALAALVAFLSMTAVRLLGVRLKWES